MMKKTLLLLMVIAMVALAFAGCGSDEPYDDDPTETPVETPADEPIDDPNDDPADDPNDEPANNATGDTNSALIGSWDWNDLGVYYVFNADGTGTRGFEALPDMMAEFDWTAENGILRITVTEGLGLTGFAEEWNYVIVGNQLDIDSRQAEGIEWSYTRAN